MVVLTSPAMTPSHLLRLVVAQSGEVVGDPDNERVVDLAVLGLVALGIAVLVVTVWFWRSTRPEPEALATLEAMSRRRFRRAVDEDSQRRILEAVRPVANAEDAHPGPGAVSDPPATGVEDVSVPLPRPLPPPGNDAPIDPLLRTPPPVR